MAVSGLPVLSVKTIEVGSISPTIVVLTFSRPCSNLTGAAHAGFSISGNTIASSYWIDNKHIGIVVDTAVVTGDSPTITYDAASGHITDTGGAALASFTAKAVSNNVVLYLHDTFTGSGALTAHTPEICPAGASWAVLNATFANLSGGAIKLTSGNHSCAIIDTGHQNSEVEAIINTGTDGSSLGLITLSGLNGVRYTCMLTATQIVEWHCTAFPGTASDEVAATTVASNTDYWLRIWSDGTTRRHLISSDGVNFTLIKRKEGGVLQPSTQSYVGIGATYAIPTTSSIKELTVRPPNSIHFSVIGDSISANVLIPSWCYTFQYSSVFGYRGIISNHAVTGQSIQNNLADQLTAAMADTSSNYLIIALGTNDFDTNIVYTTAKAQLLRALTKWSADHIFWMGILPRTYAPDNGPVNNPRIKQACDECGVTFWDTRTDPWIDPATDCSDGLHPNATGAAKISARVESIWP